MTQNIIIKGKDNPLVIDFTFNVPVDPTFGLLGFDTLEVKFGEEVYTDQADPTVVQILSDTRLQINLGSTSEEFASYFVMTGYNATYPDGYQLTSKCLGNLEIPRMC
tara:strand:- start:243 stop:563 length:321 start_codon:yes stop_codon:yes gene_type:complete